MTEFRDLFETPEANPPSLDGLWQLGRKRRRRHRLKWAAAASVVLVVAGIGVMASTRGKSGEQVISTAGGQDGSPGRDTGPCAAPDGPAALIGMDTRTGDELWQRTVADSSTAAQSGNIVATVGNAGLAQGIDMVSGTLLWCVELGAVDQSVGNIVIPGFAAVGDVVATMATGGDLVALDVSTGRELWRTKVGAIEGAQARSDNGAFYIDDVETSQPRSIVIDPETGAVEGTDSFSSEVSTTELVLVTERPEDMSGQYVQVTIQGTGSETDLWSKLVPGFTAQLAGDLVVVIDQTGGTGQIGNPSFVDTRITAYESGTGELRWQVPVPGTPQETFVVAGLVVIPVGSRVIAVDRVSGTITWEVDHGSPGRNAERSEAGSYRFFGGPDEPTVIVGLIEAEEPYRD